MTRIYLPPRFDRDTLSEFFSILDEHQDTPNVCLDCSTLNYSMPTAMLVAGSKIRDWVRYRRSKEIKSRKAGYNTNSTVHSYLMHVGFFDFILMGEGKYVGEARGSSTYLPITRIKKPHFTAGTEGLEKWYEDIMSAVRGLAKIVSGTTEDTQENRLYSYAFREIIRNVFEHSGATECYVCGQRWRNGHVEITVVDEGLGIANTLRESQGCLTDADSLLLAIKPGISRTSNMPDAENVYDNSGFGLYVLSELASSFGWYVLGSSTSRIIGHQKNIAIERLNFNGTYFGMRMQRAPTQFSHLLRDIIEAGEYEAEMNGIRRKASGMSKFL
ncbi:ATP-binding protein [Aeromonas media]|uniref:ATP-binding protein n=1 Tax=Aeromonas media TaxID=651 RepID=UPI00223FF90D|nr:ATP-binding protein [Aeromonas media]